MKLKILLKNAILLLVSLIIVSSILDFVRRPVVPEEINKITLQDLQGNTFSLESLDQNKATLLYFWGTWCGYCRYTSPAINSLAKEGYQVVSVALRSGNEADVNDYLSKNDYHFTTVNDPKGEFAGRWQINVTPTIVLLSKGKMDLVTTGLTSYWGLKVRLFFAEFFG
ncbi:protein disulfide oxidoreductase [Haemophilus haemolyticus]|uniref:protein disulfide oxidoreductase n=1 Tax=Haemophilus haemolyticus TaxID=726 RepID=UPI000E584846|nr:protein disulfide oxidoreductase [Haemophilus haemolyticus]